MNCVLSLPRSVSAVLATAAVVGIVAITYPGGLWAAGHDVREWSALQESISGAESRHTQLNLRSVAVAERIATKEGLIQQVTDGRIELPAVIARFRELNEGDPVTMSVLRTRFGDVPDDELAARNVFDYLKRHERETSWGRLPQLLQQCEELCDRRVSTR